MTASKARLNAWITLLAAIAVQALTWFMLYPLAGYNDLTLTIAQVAFLLLGAGLLFAFRLDPRSIGLGGSAFLRGLGGIALAYLLLLGVLLVSNALGAQLSLFRPEYRLDAIFNNWLLTGLGEELVFAGLLFNLIDRARDHRRRWAAVLLTAAGFALWHLPGYLAVGLRMGTLGPGLAFDLLLNMVSWCFFGSIYLLSGSLWLTAFAHASTDYALLPAIIHSPLLGLLFMLFNVLIAWRLGKRRITAAQEPIRNP